MKKLAIIVSHPIQYYAPVFTLLAQECDLKVFYTWGKSSVEERFDPDFKKSFTWDIPLLNGYTYEFLDNVSKDQGSHHYNGINNPTIINQINLFNPDAILVYGWAYKSHLKVIRHFKNKVTIWFRGDSTLINNRTSFKKILRAIFLKWVYHHIDKAFYVGTSNKAYYKAFGLSEDQLTFAPHAIDNDRFSVSQDEEVSLIRKSLGLTEADLLILFAGKLEDNKNPEILLEAFLAINQPNVHLLFVGNGILEEKLKKNVVLTPFESIAGRVHFFDFINQSKMPAIYQACNLFCLPSVSETWGLAVNEAMAASKAVLVSDHVGCAKDLIKSTVNGCIFETGNSNDLKEKLIFLLSDRNRLINMGKQSALRIKEWSFEIQASIIINELNK